MAEKSGHSQSAVGYGTGRFRGGRPRCADIDSVFRSKIGRIDIGNEKRRAGAAGSARADGVAHSRCAAGCAGTGGSASIATADGRLGIGCSGYSDRSWGSHGVESGVGCDAPESDIRKRFEHRVPDVCPFPKSETLGGWLASTEHVNGGKNGGGGSFGRILGVVAGAMRVGWPRKYADLKCS